jgi:hypothetical protein
VFCLCTTIRGAPISNGARRGHRRECCPEYGRRKTWTAVQGETRVTPDRNVT